MAVPKFRTSASKRDMRRSHHALKAKGIAYCASCGESKLPHTICKACGTYNGKVVAQAKSRTNVEGDDFAVD